VAPMSAIRFDLRRAPFSAVREGDLHREALAMTRWADEHGFVAATVSEHHGVDFMSAPLTFAGLLLGATERIRVGLSALLLPLHDPVRIAEQVATLDLMSRGRFSMTVALGYKVEEFAMAGVDRSKRGAIFEEYVEVLRKAWTGEPFEWRGRTIVVTPTPETPIEHVVMIGGSVPKSAVRAARMRLSFAAMSVNPTLGEIYRAECEKIGFTQGVYRYPTGPSFVHVAEDPERAWAELGRYALYDAQSYHSWQTGDHDNVVDVGADTVEGLKASGMWQVLTPDECVELARRSGFVSLHPLMGGIPFDLGWSSLQCYVDQVLSRLTAN
jgi:alkanesulfonate monooxygenase SsuD/methylene tetrahydromethanopterin reductase-like flavin-dependent oxidoreductase (luciferase family)